MRFMSTGVGTRGSLETNYKTVCGVQYWLCIETTSNLHPGFSFTGLVVLDDLFKHANPQFLYL